MTAPVTIYHNPACGTSRNTLALLRHAGLEPRVVEYLKTPLSADALRQLLAAMDLPARALVRDNPPLWSELGLDRSDAAPDDPQWLDALARHPALMNRPVVTTPLGTALCRPVERVLALLPVGPLAPFTKENGEVIEDDGLRRT
jgi:arsenate reductase